MEMPQGYEELQQKLMAIQIGGCTCDMKSPEIQHHAPLCHYRVFSEAQGMLQVCENIVSAIGKPAPDSETVRRQIEHEIHSSISTRFNNVLVEMRPGWDDSVCGFNDAWDIVRALFKERTGR